MSSNFTIDSPFKSKHNDPKSIVGFYRADLMQFSLGKNQKTLDKFKKSAYNIKFSDSTTKRYTNVTRWLA